MSATMEWATPAAGGRVHASEFVGIAPRLRGVVSCICCGERVTPKAGTQVTPHFAHMPESSCAMTNPETAAHFNAKMRVAEMIAKHMKFSVAHRCSYGHAMTSTWEWDVVESIAVERAVMSRKVDVLVTSCSGLPVFAIEVLHSHAVDAEKAKDLDEADVDWVEVRADDVNDRWDGKGTIAATQMGARTMAAETAECPNCALERERQAAERQAKEYADAWAPVRRRSPDVFDRAAFQRWARRRNAQLAAARARVATAPPWHIALGVALNGSRGRAVVAALSMAPGKMPKTCEVEEATSITAYLHALDYALSLVKETGRPATFHSPVEDLFRIANSDGHPDYTDEIRRRVRRLVVETGSLVVTTKRTDPQRGRWMSAASAAARRRLDELNEIQWGAVAGEVG